MNVGQATSTAIMVTATVGPNQRLRNFIKNVLGSMEWTVNECRNEVLEPLLYLPSFSFLSTGYAVFGNVPVTR
jgi:hypothetical protein